LAGPPGEAAFKPRGPVSRLRQLRNIGVSFSSQPAEYQCACLLRIEGVNMRPEFPNKPQWVPRYFGRLFVWKRTFSPLKNSSKPDKRRRT
jgi:hypothetical protein